MKKILLVLILLMLTTGCQKAMSNQYNTYVDFINTLETKDIENTYLPFDININIEKLIPSEITYKVTIDNPSEPIKNIQALVIHSYKTKDIYPSIGIFDPKVNLIPNFVDKNKNDIKGIVLIGYIPYNKELSNFKTTFKIIIKYIDNHGYPKKIYYQYQN